MKEVKDRELTSGLVRMSSSRRDILKGTASILLATPFIIGTSRADSQVVVANWGGTFAEGQKKIFFDPFEQATGIKVVLGGAPDLAKYKAQFDANNVELDLSDLSPGWLVPGQAQGLFAPVNRNIVDVSQLPKDSVRDYAVSYFTGGGGIAWNSERFGADDKHPKNWKEFWDTNKFPGRRGLFGRSQDTLEIALLADGVAPKDLYPLDVERAFAALDRIKPHIKTWFSNGNQPTQLIQTDELDFAHSFVSRSYGAMQAGAKIGYSFNQLLGRSWIAPLAKSRNPENAQKLLNFMLQPERQAAWAQAQVALPGNPAAMALLGPEIRKWLPDPTAPDVVFHNEDWWGPKLTALNKRFQEWMII